MPAPTQAPAPLLLFLSLALLGTPSPAPGGAGAAALAGEAGIVENRGQFPPEVAFRGFSGAAAVWFTPDAVILDRPDETGGGRRRAVRIAFEASAGALRLEPADPRPVRLTWLRGADPSRWAVAPTVAGAVVYREVWPGTDVRFSLDAGALRCETVAAAGAGGTPGRLRVEGDATGKTATVAAAGAAWPLDAGAGAAPGPEPSGARMIWSTFLGGAGAEYASDLALVGGTMPIVVGQTRSPGFPVTTGAYDVTYAAGYDIFVALFDPFARRLTWCTFVGGGGDDYVYAVGLDAAGRPVLAGHTESADFPTTSGAFDRTLGGGGDGCLLKLDADGGSLVWSTLLGGGGDDVIADFEFAADGRLVVVGQTGSGDFPTTVGAFDRTFGGGNHDAFVAALGADGRALAWSTLVGGLYNDFGEALAVKPDGTLLIAGNTGSPDFPTTAGAFDRIANGSDDAFVARMAADGTALLWSTLLGGSGFDQCSAFSVDVGGNALLAGTTYSADFPTTARALDRTFNGRNDVFVARVAASGSSLLMSTYLGGSGGETAFGLAADPLSAAIVAGQTASTDFPVTAGAFDASYGGGAGDAFVARITPAGDVLSWSTFLGGSGEDGGHIVSLAPNGDVVVAGTTGSADFPTTTLALDRSPNGLMEAYVSRFAQPRPVDVAPGAPATSAPAQLLPAGPSPGGGVVPVRYRLAADADVRLALHDLRGRRVRVLARGTRPAGEHVAVWDGRDDGGRTVASGLYLCRLEAANCVLTARIALTR